ncbi:hypothetical protein DFH08DRAFT_953552 [Mycena albidolilacea]|uniref:Secreted protein n=1 Tax=Mycena albidolilacea TaxID=1033008 RepID=A0AAD7EY23_9AGAR|nr:hypothetical protein DFH08DRAFT_953552 [Mycena albidolilacea]
MCLISSIHVYCAMMWGVYAAPVPVQRETAPADTADPKVNNPNPIIRGSYIFHPINIARAVEIDIEAKEQGSTGTTYCAIM